MAGARHPILYELVPWRRVRVRLAVFAVCAFGLSGVIHLLAPTAEAAPNLVGLAGFLDLCLMLGLAVRSRLSYVRVSPQCVTVRVGRRVATVRGDALVGVKVAVLGDVYRREALSRIKPLRPQWNNTRAVAFRVKSDGINSAALGVRNQTRYFHGSDLVVPVADAEAVRQLTVAAFGERVIIRPRSSGAHRASRPRRRSVRR